MDYEFRKQLYELDDIGFIGNPRARQTEKKNRLTSACIQASKVVWRDYGRELTDDERQQVVRDAERTYNREVRQKRG
jgi:hypothetical protein